MLRQAASNEYSMHRIYHPNNLLNRGFIFGGALRHSMPNGGDHTL